MTTPADLYKAPTDKIFNDIKQTAIQIWYRYDDTYNYATNKVSKIKGIENVRDNAVFLVGMFDFNNKKILLDELKNNQTMQPAYKYVKKILDYEKQELQRLMGHSPIY